MFFEIENGCDCGGGLVLIDFKKPEFGSFVYDILLDCTFEPFYPLTWRKYSVGFKGINKSRGEKAKGGVKSF